MNTINVADLYQEYVQSKRNDERELFSAIDRINRKIDEMFAPEYGCEDLYLSLSVNGTCWWVTFMGVTILDSEEPGREYDENDNEIPFAVSLERELLDQLSRLEKVNQALLGLSSNVRSNNNE